jgi:DNA phosphorothioation-associated DGQHR protein 1
VPPFPLRLPAIKVVQPLGEFFVVALDAATLQQVTFLDPTRIENVDAKSFWYSLLGAQRQASPRRAKEIGKYIDTVEAAFPNSIILAANYIDYGELQEDEVTRWRVESTDHSAFHLVIPSAKKMASVIDGQHRLLGFEYCEPARKTMELLCAVYMDLPHAYQAYLFATINFNQRKVDKSLAYEQFGYNLDEEESNGWAPDKLAVYFARKLNLDPKSPFHGRIRVAPLNAELLFSNGGSVDWQVSTACIVEGIAKLISRNPKKDRDLLHQKSAHSRARSILSQDGAPLRLLYLEGRDSEIYEIIATFFSFVKRQLWESADVRSYIRKTVGIQALFDLLHASIDKFGVSGLSEAKLNAIISSSSGVSFADPFFEASGKGRVRIKNTLLLFAGLASAEDLPDADRDLYVGLFRKYSATTT